MIIPFKTNCYKILLFEFLQLIGPILEYIAYAMTG